MDLAEVQLIRQHIKATEVELMGMPCDVLSSLLDGVELLHEPREAIIPLDDVDEEVLVNQERAASTNLAGLLIQAFVAAKEAGHPVDGNKRLGPLLLKQGMKHPLDLWAAELGLSQGKKGLPELCWCEMPIMVVVEALEVVFICLPLESSLQCLDDELKTLISPNEGGHRLLSASF
jgi:hypothetical protein